jgi:subtilisin family serine protease
MKNKILGICICMLLITAVVLPAAGIANKNITKGNKVSENQTSMEFAPGEFIVKVKQDRGFSNPELMALNGKHQVYAVEKVFPNAKGTILDNIYLLHVPIGSDILSIVQEYTLCPDVVYAEPNGISSLCGIPNDTNFSKQWSLHNTGQTYDGIHHGTPDADIDAPEAWDIETGSPDVVIAIIDTGVDYTHPDLAAKIWNNTDEIPGNGIDDDHNGYIDDIRGWDFYYNNSDPKDVVGHGTECAGVAAASTNNGIGIAGVGCNCTIMPIKDCNETVLVYWDADAKGIQYAADNGADIISMSWGDYSVPKIIEDAVNYAYSKGVFLCAAAGNNNNDIKFYPAAFENVTAVAATAHNDHRASFSTYGEWVDIAAPGQFIYSTMPTYHVVMNDYGLDQNYDFNSGTSFSSPMTAGVAALLLSKDPSLTPDEIKTLLCESVDPYNSTQYIGTGRLNAQKALTALQLKDGVKIKGGFGVKLDITNNGTSDVTNVTWQIHVEGGTLGMINKTVNGTIDIPAGKSVTVKTGMLLGFGTISITAEVADEEQTATGTQLIIFSMVKK